MLPGIAVTTVNPGLFADSPYLATINLAAHLGLLPWMFGDSRAAPPSVDDIGRVAAAALMDPARHAGRRYRPTGPQLLSGEDMAGILARVFERRVRLVPTPIRLFHKAAYLDGNPLVLLGAMAHYVEEHRRGAFALNAPNHEVEQVTGREAEPFEAVARRLAALTSNRRSRANTLREFARFMLMPFMPMPNIRRYMSRLQVPEPSRPEYIRDSRTWWREHGFEASPGDDALNGPISSNLATR
jgi:hypothetical protein